MNEFDISFDGYKPQEGDRQRTPYRSPSRTGGYRPPQEDEPYRPPQEDNPYTPPRDDNTVSTSTVNGNDSTATHEATPPKARHQDKEEREAKAEERRRRREERIKELKKEKTDDNRPLAIVRFFTDERMRVFLASVLLILSIFVIIGLMSHFATGAHDQSIATNLTIGQMAEQPGLVHNATGGIGAVLSKVLVCDALGLGAIVLIPYMWILALALLGIRKCNFWATTFRCLLLAIAISIVLGYLTYNSASVIYWGGNHGHYVNKWLIENTTWIGALCVTLILICAVCCVYLNELKIAWRKWRAVYQRHKQQEELRRERRRELEQLEAEEAAEAEREARERQNKGIEAIDNTSQTQNADDTPRIINLSAGLQDTPSHPEIPDTTVVDLSEYVDDEASDARGLSSALDLSTGTGMDFSVDASPRPAEPSTGAGAPAVADAGADADKDDSILIIDPDNLDRAQDGSLSMVDDNFSIVAPAIEEADPNAKPAEQDTGLYDHKAELPGYHLPPIDLLEDRPSGPNIDIEEQQANKALIEKTLLDYKIPISKIEATVGPTVTLYEIVPAEGVRISQIKRLEDDIALSLKALGIRIIAPIPGKGTVGIEVPNNDPQTVSMRSVLNSKKYQECKMALPMAMGATISNDIFIADMAKMPHLLVAGATGMGKSVGLNAIIASFLYKKHPSELKLVLIDPKMVEFSLYSKLENHYLAKLPNEEDAIITDMKKVIQTLNSLCVEMDDRYELLREANVRSLEEYNKKFTERRLSPADGHKYLPYIVVIVDEFADLIMTQGKEVEQPIARIAQKARAVGIHMILATQRPSTNVITGLIKANFPGRIAFRVIQMVDSRTILDMPGANQLIGRGDMLFSHNGIMDRVQCAFISTEEVEALTEFINSQRGYDHAYYLPEFVPDEAEGGAIAGASMERDTLFNEAARFVVTRQMGSTSSLQRQFGIGYNRAGKLMDQLEAAGVVGPVNGAKPRSILMDIVTLESILGE